MKSNFKGGRQYGASAAALAFAMLVGGTSHAQEAPAAADEQVATVAEDDTDTDTDTDTAKTEIVVTGTNISGVKPVGSEAVSLNREQILATGMTSPADVVRTLPQVRNLGEFREGGTYGGNNSQQGNAINLRGLGAAATLVLVDGHRVVATGASANFTEANQVPIAALARIEVIADGASAVYGSDAVAGVVNFVLRKDFDGVEASFRMSNSNGGTEVTPGLTAGTHWDAGSLGPGNIIVSYEYTKRDPYLRGKNKWLRQDLRAVGGPDLRVNGTNSGTSPNGANIYVGTPGVNNATLPLAGANTYYGLPRDSSGVGISFAQLRLNDPNLIDTADFTDYTGQVKRHHIAGFFNQKLGDWLEVFAQGTYSHRHTYSRQISSFLGAIENVTVPAFLYDPVTNAPDPTKPNPAYISGIPGVAPGTPINAQYNFYPSSGYQNWDNEVKDYNVTAGVRIYLPKQWKAEAYFTRGYDDACNFCALGKNINPDALQYLINIGTINPFSTAPLSQSTLSRLYGDNLQKSGNTFSDWVAKFDGPLFRLPGGMVRAAFGGEINKQANWNVNGRNKGIDNKLVIDTDKARSIGRRTITSEYAELYLPIIGRDMELPVIRELTVDGAIRHDSYSDVGSTTNPKIGVTLVAGDTLTLRGSWGTSFRAPGLPDVNPSAISTSFPLSPFPNNNPNIANDFCIPGNPPTCLTTLGLIAGANPDVRPEKATNWSVGGEFKPVKNLKLSATYYSIDYTDRIASPGFAFINYAINPGYPGYNGYAAQVVPINNTNVTGPTSCTQDPKLVAFLSRPILYGFPLTSPCFLKGILDGRNINLAATRQDGIDAQIDYMVPIKGGAISFNASVNKVLHNKQQVSPGSAFVDMKGLPDQPIEWKGRGSVGGFWHGFNTTLFLNYTGAYNNTGAVNPVTNVAIGTQRVKPWTTFDLNLGYSATIDRAFLKGFRVSVNVQNLGDRDPPAVITSNGAFNASYSNPFGRTVTAQLSASF